MLDSANDREPAQGTPGEAAPHRRSEIIRRNLLEALQTARAIVLVGLIPLQLSVWFASLTGAAGFSQAFTIVSAALFGLLTAYVGLILVLRLAIAENRRRASRSLQATVGSASSSPPAERGSGVRRPIAGSVPPQSSPPPTPGANSAIDPPNAARASEMPAAFKHGAGLSIAGGAYVLVGSLQSATCQWLPQIMPICVDQHAAIDQRWLGVAPLVWQIAVPALLIEMLWSAISL